MNEVTKSLLAELTPGWLQQRKAAKVPKQAPDTDAPMPAPTWSPDVERIPADEQGDHIPKPNPKDDEQPLTDSDVPVR